MEAGRKLDALVAKKVMGWPEDDPRIVVPYPRYSTDIAAAWMVLPYLVDPILERRAGKWSVRYRIDHNGSKWAHADTAPHAICLAALRAVGVEVPE